jgi:ABC-2 type transport system permease protein
MLNTARRGFAVATWLGWQIESNWTDPFLFFIYSVLKPIASVMILVVMYLIISRQATQSPLFAYIYLGNAFYIYVGGVMTGVSWAVIDDREHYSTLKYIYLAPFPYLVYLLGRGVARFITATMAVVITLAFGILVFGLPLRLAQINLPLFFVTLVLGILSLAFLGLFLGALTLLMTRESWEVGEGVAGALYIFSGAIFPLSVLPTWLRPIGLVLPITYWLELIRRSLLGSTAAAFPTFATTTDLELLAILAGMTILYGVLAVLFFRWAENRARQRGLLDVQTQF